MLAVGPWVKLSTQQAGWRRWRRGAVEDGMQAYTFTCIFLEVSYSVQMWTEKKGQRICARLVEPCTCIAFKWIAAQSLEARALGFSLRWLRGRGEKFMSKLISLPTDFNIMRMYSSKRGDLRASCNSSCWTRGDQLKTCSLHAGVSASPLRGSNN